MRGVKSVSGDTGQIQASPVQGDASLSRRACRNAENSLISESRAWCRKAKGGRRDCSTKHATMSVQRVQLVSAESTFLHSGKAQTWEIMKKLFQCNFLLYPSHVYLAC